MNDQRMNPDLGLLAAWQVGTVQSAYIPDTGTINRTLVADTITGRFVLRCYRHIERAPIEREHAAIAYARDHGIPAVAPLALPNGEMILLHDGRFYALFPHAPGAQIAGADLSADQLAAMGACLAALHAALADFPLQHAKRRDITIDLDATLARIERVEAAIRTRPALADLDCWVLEQLRGRRDWIARSPRTGMPDLTVLAQQLIHGDYQETNLFFEGDRVVAVIDWDQTYVAPRAWELVRALDLTCAFEAERCRAFLAGYRALAPLAAAELDLAAAAYTLMRAHDLWIYEAIYIAGNDRPRRYVQPAPFVPLIDRWRVARRACL